METGVPGVIMGASVGFALAATAMHRRPLPMGDGAVCWRRQERICRGLEGALKGRATRRRDVLMEDRSIVDESMAG